jgi:peptidoglycan/xylan/chitin deacetylase (PgdA/CDA1 family)
MVAAGWDVGSHSRSHIDLPSDHESAHDEIRQSKLDLEEDLGIDNIRTFAYPYGKIDEYIAKKVSSYGYEAAVGLGKGWKHDWNDIYYLERIEIYGNYTLDDIAKRLPWPNSE